MSIDRKITANWNIADDIMDQAAKNMADDIDFEVLNTLLCEDNGWTRVVLRPMTWEDGLEIDGWVEQNVKGKFRTRGLVWVFERPSDASWFTIRWT
jgi:hypothetical protein